jgi:beta-mannanase
VGTLSFARILSVALVALALGAAPASANTYLPGAGHVLTGVAGATSITDFQARTGKHPAIWQFFVTWGGNDRYAIDAAEAAGSALMLHVSTAVSQDAAHERLSPGAIAAGRGDAWLTRLTRDLQDFGRPIFVRPFGEMNNCHNAYSSYSCTGARRDAAHSPAALRRAYVRMYIVMHGGTRAAVDARLRHAGLPALRAGADELPKLPVAFVWSPMTGGSPNIAALRPQVYWPGGRYVDIVGTSFYSKFPTWQYLDPFYRTFAAGRHKPFMFAEWAMWGPDNPAFPHKLFAWVRTHPLVRAMVYNQGQRTNGPFRLRSFPRAARVIRAGLRSSRYLTLAPAL